MARPVSQKILQLREHLVTQIRSGYFPPGARFLSARAIATRHAVSYQSAHRVLADLAEGGWLERRAGSGSFVAGAEGQERRVVLCFHPRAQRPASFGGRLLEAIRGRLGADVQVRFADDPESLDATAVPVIWEDATTLQTVIARRQYAVLLNEAPPPGLSATLIDSVMVDDFSGGVVAGEIARDAGFIAEDTLVFAGPDSDYRSNDRLRGFQRIFPETSALFARSWYREQAMDDAARVLDRAPRLVFCANDGLAEALVEIAEARKLRPPALIGFDNAPIAEERGFTTIAMPWSEFAEFTATIVSQRLTNSSQTATRRILSPRPILRQSHLPL